MPDFIEPQLTKLVDRAPSEPGWVHEIKLDGYRLQLRVEDGKATLKTRKGLDWTRKFQAIADVAEQLPDCMIDGEACALDHTGAPDFAGLQAALSEGRSEDLDLLRLRPDVRRGRGSAAVAAGRSQGAAGGVARRPEGQAQADPLRRAFRDGRRCGARLGLPHASRRHRLEAAGCALPVDALGDLDEGQVPRRPGSDHRRLDARRAEACARSLRACIAAKESTRSWCMSAGSARASAKP